MKGSGVAAVGLVDVEDRDRGEVPGARWDLLALLAALVLTPLLLVRARTGGPALGQDADTAFAPAHLARQTPPGAVARDVAGAGVPGEDR